MFPTVDSRMVPSIPNYQASRPMDSLRPVDGGIERPIFVGVHGVQAGSHLSRLVLGHELRDGHGVELAAVHSQARGKGLRGREERIRQGDRGLHSCLITDAAPVR